MARFEAQRHAPGIADIAGDTGRSVEHTARVAFAAVDYVRLSELESRAAALRITDYYDRLAIDSGLEAIRAAGRSLAKSALRDHFEGPPDFAAWLEANTARLAQVKHTLDEIAAAPDITVSRLTVAASRVRALAGD
jgi:NAD-specific glutamate dehydrogenase